MHACLFPLLSENCLKEWVIHLALSFGSVLVRVDTRLLKHSVCTLGGADGNRAPPPRKCAVFRRKVDAGA